MINIVHSRIVYIQIALSYKENALIVHHGLFQCGDGFFATDVKMQNHMRESQQPPQRQHRQADRLSAFFSRLSQCFFLLYPPCFS